MFPGPSMEGFEAKAELERERAALVKADRDIASGQERIERQRALLDSGKLASAQLVGAEDLLDTLESCLAEWRQHRSMMQARIDYLSHLTGEGQPAEDPGVDTSRADVPSAPSKS